MKLTKQSREKLYNRYNGNGVLFIRTAPNEITSIEIHLGRNGKFYAGKTEISEYLHGLSGQIEEDE